jgi:DNA-binding MarR family transcriptional regulator
MNSSPRNVKALGKTTIRLPCACANLRRADRVVTLFYDAVLRPSGMRITQFTLLQALHYAPGISQKQLAELLEIDSTTLTRTLAPLVQKGWLQAEAGADRRELRLRLTAAGKREYKRVIPYWQKAQKSMQKALGRENWTHLINATVHTAGAMLKPG